MRLFELPPIYGSPHAARFGALLTEGSGDPAGFDFVVGLFDIRASDGFTLHLSKGCSDDENEYDEYDDKGDEGVDIRHGFEPSLPVIGLDEELETDEHKDRGEPVVEVDRPLEGSFDEEEELAESHEYEDVGDEDDGRLSNQPEGRRYRVEREHEVHQSDRDDAQKERRDEGFIISPYQRFVSDEAVGDYECLVCPANDGVRFVRVVVMVRVLPVLGALVELVPCRPREGGGEDEEQSRKTLEEDGT